MRELGSLLPFLVLVVGAAAFGAIFQPGAWYEALRKPPGNPPKAMGDRKNRRISESRRFTLGFATAVQVPGRRIVSSSGRPG